MKVVENENVVLCDVDDTLIEDYTPPTFFVQAGTVPLTEFVPNEEYLQLDYYGKPVAKKAIQVHVDFVKSLKARGYFIVVHSGNGYQWAAQVVKAVGLEDHVDMVMTKAIKHIDDNPDPQHIIGTRIYLV